jgi:hypothetical protein
MMVVAMQLRKANEPFVVILSLTEHQQQRWCSTMTSHLPLWQGHFCATRISKTKTAGIWRQQ